MTASPGTIYYSIDGVTDPRLIGGERQSRSHRLHGCDITNE